jgi:hypothetical protein
MATRGSHRQTVRLSPRAEVVGLSSSLSGWDVWRDLYTPCWFQLCRRQWHHSSDSCIFTYGRFQTPCCSSTSRLGLFDQVVAARIENQARIWRRSSERGDLYSFDPDGSPRASLRKSWIRRKRTSPVIVRESFVSRASQQKIVPMKRVELNSARELVDGKEPAGSRLGRLEVMIGDCGRHWFLVSSIRLQRYIKRFGNSSSGLFAVRIMTTTSRD